MTFEPAQPGVLVVSESWHPDWVATDNGQLVEVRRANHGVLGIPVEAGSHSIRLRYWPWDFYMGCVISGAFWLALGGTAVISGIRRRGNHRFEER